MKKTVLFFLASLAAFTVDALAPIGFIRFGLYIIVAVSAGLYLDKKNSTFILVFCIVLSIIGFFIPPYFNPQYMAILNRTINGIAMVISYQMIIGYKKVNEELKILYEEKGTHLKEIHHRVKNNLQVISSMIGIAIHEVEGEKTTEIFNTIRQRIDSMGLIHDKLSIKNTGSVNTKEFIEDLVDKISAGFDHNGKAITIKTDINDIPLVIEICLSLGMIINEVVYNSLKHAFKGRDGGILDVKLKMAGDKVYLIIKDDGIGFKEKTETQRRGLGLLIIEDLVEKLQGKYQFSNENGTLFNLSFPHSLN